ncbi:replication initiator protein [Dipodfec virus UOA04_Rod_1082]|nr:replication initiator protein [Dipodfec virus UOA04_Rod_1082]
MTCFHPLTAYKAYSSVFDLRPEIVFSEYKAERAAKYEKIQLPCGQCLGCRLDYSRDWSIRCMHELKYSKDAWFITLTYDDQHLPSDLSLDPDHLRDFWKRFRKFVGSKVRYFACGEYGDRFQRPHFHSIVFFDSVQEKKLVGRLKSGFPVFNSEVLVSSWPFGYVSIANVSLNTCAYVARYVTKKLTGKQNDFYSESFEVDDDGVITSSFKRDFFRYPDGRIKPFCRCSRMPGLGRRFIEEFYSDVYPLDKCVFFQDGKPKSFSVPRYYDKFLETYHPELWSDVKESRLQKAQEISQNDDFSLDSMARREEALISKLESHMMNKFGTSFSRKDF